MAVVLGSSACGSDVSPEAGDAPSDAASSALAFSAPLVGGGELDGAAYQGRPLVLWFWAPT